MSNLQHFSDNQQQATSPFDSIRHFDESCNEYWIARDLMEILGYKKWQFFVRAIEFAKENLEALEYDLSTHFLREDVKTKGRPKEDYKLSRLACYHIALSCDSRGNERVKHAKHYFAIKTREAEVKIPEQTNRIEELKLELEIERNKTRRVESNERLFDKSHFILTAHGEKMLALMMGQPDAVVEKVEYRDRTVIVDEKLKPIAQCDGVGIGYLAKRYGFGKGKKANDACREWLESIGITENDWVQELTAHAATKLPRDLVEKADHHWANGNGDRQKLLGE